MSNDLKEVLKSYVKSITSGINDNQIEHIINNLNPVKYKKGTILVRQGNIASNCYFILEGCIRMFFVDENGNENTTGFYIEKDSITILESYRLKKESPYSLECLEDTTVIEGDINSEKEIKQGNDSIQEVIQGGLEHELSKSITEQAHFRALSPKERYLYFLENHPDVANRVPGYQLASYLGIKPESLSRIKRRLN